MATRNSFKSGSAELLVLHLLNKNGDSYGYEISQLIRQLSGGSISFPEGSLYPTFYKLIENRCITDYKKTAGKRLVRVYYHLEPKGLERLNQLKEEYYRTNAGIQSILNYDFTKTEGTEDE